MAYQWEYVRCGKRTCHTCPHGPYLYEYWRQGKRTRKHYWGKIDPRDDSTLEDLVRPEQPFSDMADPRTANEHLARTILDYWGHDSAELASVYRSLCKLHHLDRGGDGENIKWVTLAYTWLKIHLTTAAHAAH